MVQLIVQAADELPIYRQIMRQIVEAIAGGRLQQGEKLASHRDLAEQLVVAPLTVKKAYDELETAGYLETQRGRGTFVSAHPPRVKASEQRERVKAAARKLLSEAWVGGLSLDEVQEVLRQESVAMAGEKPSSGSGAPRNREAS